MLSWPLFCAYGLSFGSNCSKYSLISLFVCVNMSLVLGFTNTRVMFSSSSVFLTVSSLRSSYSILIVLESIYLIICLSTAPGFRYRLLFRHYSISLIKSLWSDASSSENSRMFSSWNMKRFNSTNLT